MSFRKNQTIFFKKILFFIYEEKYNHLQIVLGSGIFLVSQHISLLKKHFCKKKN